uniref:Phorbol-ester/DAG-type domain-containing protein n=1 Tax=Heterorhabditis bacteriophora TaxID=37862 RepID=A0A1I7XA42_HETBA
MNNRTRSRTKEQSPMLSPSTPQGSSMLNSQPSPVISPKSSCDGSDFKLIYVHLPFDQHSRLEVRAGQTARDAISKLLKKRNITPQLCHVNVSADPRSERIDLQDLASIAARLEKNELWVHSEYLDTVSSIKHTIVRKTFIPPVNCDVCKNPIWLVGYRCEFCQFKFHQRCSSFAPLYCDLIQTVPRDEDLARRLLKLLPGQYAEMAESVLTQLQPNPSPVHTPESSHPDLTLKRYIISCMTKINKSLEFCSRSSSAPNINAINDEAALEHNQRILDALEAQRQVENDNAIRPCKGKLRPHFHSGQLVVTGRRPANRLHPLSDTSPYGSNSPSSDNYFIKTKHLLENTNYLSIHKPASGIAEGWLKWISFL